ncbi:hypothetical protein LCM4579_02850 [Ensifer sp. LCM 4579]|nr:hypothetical protein LCM4579_02850 [Ensifer sp. LCM 4579]
MLRSQGGTHAEAGAAAPVQDAVRGGFARHGQRHHLLGNNVHAASKTSKGNDLSVRLPFGHEAISGLDRGDAVWLKFDAAAAHVFGQ